MRRKLHRPKGKLGIAVAFGVAALLGLSATTHRARAEHAEDDPGISLEVNLSERKLHIKQADSTLETFAVAIGTGSKPTPRGTYQIRKIIWNPAWIPPDQPWAKGKEPQPPGATANPMKLVKMFFQEPDYYIHGTGDLESLGDAASHGCLRMDPDDAYRVARYLMQHGGQPQDENWFWRVLHFRSETKTVMLDHPIAMTVSE